MHALMPPGKKETFGDIRDYSLFHCHLHGLMTLLTGPWTTYLLWMIHQNGEMRFGELKKQMPGISAKVLTQRLRMLEEAGIVYREHVATIPPQVTYGFTSRGEELAHVLLEIRRIADKWIQEDTAKN